MTDSLFRRLTRFICIASLIAPISGCGNDDLLWARLGVAAALNVPALVDIQSNIEYAARETTSLHLDLYRPVVRTQSLPLVIVIHGGSWRSGSKEDMAEFAYDVAAHGMAAASLDYRLIQKGGTFPAPVLDTIDATAFLRDRAADFGIDPDRLAVLGVSAGGHLALLSGLVDDLSKLDAARPTGRPFNFKAIVNIEGPTDFTVNPADYTSRQIRLIEGFLGKTIADDEDGSLRRAASAVTYVRADGPPVLIIHGTADQTVPFAQAQSLEAALEAAGQSHVFIPIEGMDHIPGALWLGPWVQSYRAAMLAFLQAALQ